MDTFAAPTYVQALSDAEHAGSVARWRAAQTVRARVLDTEARDELLGALGLLDAVCPDGL
ncbi:MAG TPA: hypothetical protein VFR07_16890 [Mycobacteriales bacterium]|jgi:hypothetical protein|nr:hypothetical protein [Mycobacteriales bacterium]